MVEPVIVEEFIVSGDLAFEYRDYAFINDESILAAEASRCANDQGKFWEMHDMIYYNQDNTNLDGTSRSALDIMAQAIGLDMMAFATCMDDQTHRDAVVAEFEEGQSLGVTGTPALFINGELVTGIETYDELLQMIQVAIDGN